MQRYVGRGIIVCNELWRFPLFLYVDNTSSSGAKVTGAAIKNVAQQAIDENGLGVTENQKKVFSSVGQSVQGLVDLGWPPDSIAYGLRNIPPNFWATIKEDGGSKTYSLPLRCLKPAEQGEMAEDEKTSPFEDLPKEYYVDDYKNGRHALSTKSLKLMRDLNM